MRRELYGHIRTRLKQFRHDAGIMEGLCRNYRRIYKDNIRAIAPNPLKAKSLHGPFGDCMVA